MLNLIIWQNFNVELKSHNHLINLLRVLIN